MLSLQKPYVCNSTLNFFSKNKECLTEMFLDLEGNKVLLNILKQFYNKDHHDSSNIYSTVISLLKSILSSVNSNNSEYDVVIAEKDLSTWEAFLYQK